MPLQDREDIRRGVILGGEGMRTYRYRKILCGEGYQQEVDGRKGTYGIKSSAL